MKKSKQKHLYDYEPKTEWLHIPTIRDLIKIFISLACYFALMTYIVDASWGWVRYLIAGIAYIIIYFSILIIIDDVWINPKKMVGDNNDKQK
jgi:hypothetical protein